MLVHEVQLRVRQSVQEVPQLVRVDPEVVVGHHPRDVLAVEIVVGGVDVPDKSSSHGWVRTGAGLVLLPDTPVCVVVTVGAGTERASGPYRGGLPDVC